MVGGIFVDSSLAPACVGLADTGDASTLELRDHVALFKRTVGMTASTDASRARFRAQFRALSSRLRMYPPAQAKPYAVFEALARDAREVASECLPLAIALSMHWYPLCVLQCAALPMLSGARVRRALLLRSIKRSGLIVANAGGDRSDDSQGTVVASRCSKGFVLSGTCEYMSLASVADVVFIKAHIQQEPRELFCLASLRGLTAKIGSWRFSGSMRLSDTASVEFDKHLVPRGYHVELPHSGPVQCLAQYQRSWFHLFIAEVYMARALQLCATHALPIEAEVRLAQNEFLHLRAYCLSLLEMCTSPSQTGRLFLATGTLKLRVSRFTQWISGALTQLGDLRRDPQLGIDAAELLYIARQPTADRKIMEMI